MFPQRGNYQLRRVDPRNSSPRLSRKVGLYVYAQHSFFFPPFISSSPSCQHVLPDTRARARARTRKPTEYSQKSLRISGSRGCFCKRWICTGAVGLKISVALGSHIPSAHKYWRSGCHVPPLPLERHLSADGRRAPCGSPTRQASVSHKAGAQAASGVTVFSLFHHVSLLHII